MSFTPQSRTWTGKRAVLLVHGIGNSRPGDYADLLHSVETLLGPSHVDVALYQLFYDHINDWFVQKTDASALLGQATAALAQQIDDPEIGATIAGYIGDILWPVLSTSARGAVREAYLAQLKQMVLDGENAGVPVRRQQLTIIAHSLGCFHTYEALHHAAKYSSHILQPSTHEVRFANVIYVASPVQLIRTVAERLGSLVPNRRWLETVQGDTLHIPFETRDDGKQIQSVRNWVSITGNLDPVGGHFFRKRADWAYMQVDGQHSFIDQQFPTDVTSKADLIARLRTSKLTGDAPTISPRDPHAWGAYIERHTADLRDWILA